MSSEEIKQKQKDRAFLREGFLSILEDLVGKNCKIVTHEMSTLKGKLTAYDPEFNEIVMEDLATPSGIVPHAIVRATDIVYLEVIECKSLED